MRRPKFGDRIVVSKVLEFHYDENQNRVCTTHLVPTETYYLVGIRYRPVGKYIRGTGTGGFEDEYSPPELHIKGVVKVALVSKSLHRNPISIPYEDIAEKYV